MHFSGALCQPAAKATKAEEGLGPTRPIEQRPRTLQRQFQSQFAHRHRVGGSASAVHKETKLAEMRIIVAKSGPLPRENTPTVEQLERTH